MMHYSVQLRERIFVKGYEFLIFSKNMGKSIGKNISKNLSGKYNERRLDHAQPSATDGLKTTSKRVIQKTAEATDDLIGNKIADSIMKFSRSSAQNNSETITNEYNKKYVKKDVYL